MSIHEQTHVPLPRKLGSAQGFAQDWGPQLDSASQLYSADTQIILL